MSSPRQSSFKFPKALAAAGLAAVLVGCGGGSESTSTGNEGNRGQQVTPTKLTAAEATPVPGSPFVADAFTLQPGTSRLLTNGHHQVVCPPSGDACMVTVDATGISYTGAKPTVALTAKGSTAIANYRTPAQSTQAQKDLLAGLEQDVLNEINDLVNYETDKTDSDYGNATAMDAIEDLDDEVDSPESKTYLTAAERTEYKNKIREFKRIIARNTDGKTWLEGFGDWDAKGTLNYLDPGNVSVATSNITVTSDFGDKTDIMAPPLVHTKITDVPKGWEGSSFEDNNDKGAVLKVFTSHEDAKETIYTSEWGEFWGDHSSDDGYEQHEIFGTGDSGVETVIASTNDHQFGTLDGNPAGGGGELEGKTFITVETPETVAAIAADATTTTDTMLTQIRTKIHKNDVVMRSDSSTEVKLTSSPMEIVDFTALSDFTFGSETDRDSLFLGQSGGFTCKSESNGTYCALSLDKDGFIVVALYRDAGSAVIANDKATLKFVSEKNHDDLKDEEVKFMRPDTTYMTMGYWMSEDGDIIDTFAKARYWYGDVSETPTGLTSNIGLVKGNATYKGQAVGAYVLNKGKMQGTDIDLYRGEFQAEVELTADFGRSISNNNDPFKVEGTIDEFKSFTRDSDDLSSWELTLNESTVNTPGGAFRGTTTGGGEWQGQFYGNTGIEMPGADNDFPEAAVGEFSGDFGNHNEVVGVFGTEKN